MSEFSPAQDVPRAQEALVEVRREFADFDWSAVDIPEEEPEADRPPTDSNRNNRRLQFGIAALLIVQVLASAALAFWRTVYVRSGSAVATFVTVYAVMSAVMIVFTVAATVVVATDLSRGRRVAVLIVLAELVAFSVIGVVACALMELAT